MTDIPVRGKSGTLVTFGSNTDTVTWTPKNVANGAGRVSAQYDLGALGTARPERFGWHMRTACQATPTANALLRLYLARWNAAGTEAEGGITAATDAAFATEANLVECDYIGNVVIRAATASIVFRRSGELWIPAHVRYVSLVGWNATGAALTNTDADHQFALYPIEPTIVA